MGSSALAIWRPKATATPPSTGSAPISAEGQATTNPSGPKCAATATPCALRTITDAQGTTELAAASTAAVPKRIVPAFSASVPSMKPGSSTRLTIGRWNVSQSSMKRRVFWEPAAVIAPARCQQSLASTPTGWPASRARPVIVPCP